MMSNSTLEGPKKRRLPWSKRELPGVAMAAPGIVGLIVFVAAPFLVAVFLSFHNAQLNSPRSPNFIGITQFTRLFDDAEFWRALGNNVTFAAVVIPVQTAIALGLAMLVNQRLKGISIFRALFFLPVIFPMALVAVIWRLILARSEGGILNSIVDVITFGRVEAQDWLGNPTTALPSIILLSIWQGVGFQMIILLAGLQEIPQERYEAAQLDRANRWQQFLYVTLPGLRNTLIFVVLLTSILAFRVYDQVYILITSGGANEAATQTVLYQATTSVFDQNNLGRASAITVVFFAIVLGITILQRRLIRQESEA
ncbi:sugar ABC transporter permease [Demequina sp. TTPB684]|uniref:carbohydrate ABC transporter permease n=1 Tax=unclassified Demequina TaxID=2620311 RepID=UPI001CF21097|nr:MULTISPECIES: sugar ABC transporter permease [unclassified Demequina]MCB2412813.1 sugar ABC transporter permease [Demequina sp. TTPB684]UPU87449.1 sugar ABC transporter permease [Demequina sp. TMPB413]